MKYTVNPFIIFYYSIKRKKLMLFEPINKKVFELRQDFFFDLLDYCEKGREKTSIVKKIVQLLSDGNPNAYVIIEDLIKSNLLLKQDRTLKKNIEKSSEWFSYGWGSSFYYHLASKDFKFLDYSIENEVLKDQKLMKTYLNESLPPPIYKEYKNNKFYPLLPISEFEEVKFPPHGTLTKKLNKQKLSYMLYLTFGEIFSANFPIVGKILAKTSPSGGARHPSEAYILLLKNLDNIPAGVYHYSVKRNGLEYLTSLGSITKTKKYFYKTSHVKDFNAEVIIVISSIFERNMWRYREIRTFRVIFLDIGHLLSTLRIITKSLGMDVLINHSFDDYLVQKLLGLTTGKERPLYCAIIGKYK